MIRIWTDSLSCPALPAVHVAVGPVGQLQLHRVGRVVGAEGILHQPDKINP